MMQRTPEACASWLTLFHQHRGGREVRYHVCTIPKKGCREAARRMMSVKTRSGTADARKVRSGMVATVPRRGRRARSRACLETLAPSSRGSSSPSWGNLLRALLQSDAGLHAGPDLEVRRVDELRDDSQGDLFDRRL